MSAREHWYWDQHTLLRSLGTVKHPALFITHEGFELGVDLQIAQLVEVVVKG